MKPLNLTAGTRRFIEKHKLLEASERVLIACSGGPDSICLLMVLRELWPQTAAVYVNHMLRGEDSMREEEFVRKFCMERSISLFVETIHWKTVPGNLEEAARKKRYRHLAKVAAEHGFHKVALGHQREDVAETFLLRLIRGSGPHGLAVLPPQRGMYIRPLLECGRAEILEYLSDNNIPYVTDVTNADLRFQRNRVRNELVPYLQKNMNPDVVSALFRASRWLLEQRELIREVVSRYEQLIQTHGPAFALPKPDFLALSGSMQKALLRKVLEKADPGMKPGARTLEALVGAIAQGETRELPGFLKMNAAGESIEFVPKQLRIGVYEVDVPAEGKYSFPPADAHLGFTIRQLADFRQEAGVAFLDAECATFPLHIRNWKHGDRFRPLGLSGTKKLSDFFIDARIPKQERKKIPLVFKDEDLIWVAGHQIHHDYRITEKTTRVLRIDLLRQNV